MGGWPKSQGDDDHLQTDAADARQHCWTWRYSIGMLDYKEGPRGYLKSIHWDILRLYNRLFLLDMWSAGHVTPWVYRQILSMEMLPFTVQWGSIRARFGQIRHTPPRIFCSDGLSLGSMHCAMQCMMCLLTIRTWSDNMWQRTTTHTYRHINLGREYSNKHVLNHLIRFI